MLVRSIIFLLLLIIQNSFEEINFNNNNGEQQQNEPSRDSGSDSLNSNGESTDEVLEPKEPEIEVEIGNIKVFLDFLKLDILNFFYYREWSAYCP